MTAIPEPTTHRIDWIICPFCTVMHDGALNIDGQEKPEDGDANICGKCARVSIYDSTIAGRLRTPTLDEYQEMRSNPDIQRAVAIAKTVRHIVHRTKAASN